MRFADNFGNPCSGSPDPVHSCRSNTSLFSVEISCQAGYSGGENQHFILRKDGTLLLAYISINKTRNMESFWGF